MDLSGFFSSVIQSRERLISVQRSACSGLTWEAALPAAGDCSFDRVSLSDKIAVSCWLGSGRVAYRDV